MLIEHLSSPGRPNATASLALLIECLTALGITEGLLSGSGDCCRLGPPNHAAIMVKLRAARQTAKADAGDGVSRAPGGNSAVTARR